MKALLTVNRIRAMIAGSRTEKDLELALRRHKVKYSYSTDHGFLQFLIPCRAGYIRIYRTCSRSAPFLVSSVPAVPYIAPVPVIHHW